MRLSPIDHIFTGKDAYSIQFVFFYRDLPPIADLQNSLDLALKKFSPLSKVLKKENDTYFLTENSKIRIEEINKSDLAFPKLENTDQLNDHCLKIDASVGKSLMRVQLCTYNDGISLTLNISHCLVDGYSYFMFFQYWANVHKCIEMCGKLSDDLLEFSPVIDRSILCPDESEWVKSNEDVSKGGLSLSNKRSFGEITNSKIEIVKVSRDLVKRELAKASEFSAKRFSENDILTVILLKKFVEIWNQSGDLIELRSAFDFRRVYKKISRLYFGNAVSIASANISYDDLYKLENFELAELVRCSTSSIKEGQIKLELSALEKFRMDNGLESCQRFHVANPDRGYLFTNLSRMPVQSLSFGQDAPVNVYPLVPGPRTFVIMASKEDYIVRVTYPLHSRL
jgi:hypothetical protein